MASAATSTPIDAAYFDFVTDARREFARMLEDKGYAIHKAKTLEEVLFVFFNVHLRSIAMRPRRVHRSRELCARNLSRKIRVVLDAIERKAMRGEDLNPYLHRPIETKPKYNDMLLNDWGLHHLHLGSVEPVQGTRFVARSEELLFMRIARDDIYLVDVLDHGAFVQQELVEILHSNWPHVLAPQHLKGISGGFVEPPSARYVLRKAGGVMFTTVRDGTTYAPFRGGYSTSGLHVSVVTAADNVAEMLDTLGGWCRDNMSMLRDQISAQTGSCPNLLRLELTIDSGGRFIVRERTIPLTIATDIGVAPL